MNYKYIIFTYLVVESRWIRSDVLIVDSEKVASTTVDKLNNLYLLFQKNWKIKEQIEYEPSHPDYDQLFDSESPVDFILSKMPENFSYLLNSFKNISKDYQGHELLELGTTNNIEFFYFEKINYLMD